jgi:cytochrome c peroxidase
MSKTTKKFSPEVRSKLLFFDPRLSASEVISCNSCHNLATGGVDAGPTSVGHG